MRVNLLLTALILAGACNSAPMNDTAATSTNNQADKNIEKIILQKEDQWATALTTDDSVAFEKLLANDFTFINPDGTTMDRRAYIADRSKNELPTDSFKLSDFKVIPYGNTALVSGLTEFYGSNTSHQYHLKLRWKELWILENGDWKVVAGQGTPVNPEWLSPFILKDK